MKLLLDTHTLIWFFESSNKLSQNAKTIIENPINHNYVSVASIWEMSIKVSLGKLMLSKPLLDVVQHIKSNHIQILPVGEEHALEVRNMLFHHRDPFDRLIIAQSIVEGMSIISKDRIFDQYVDNRIW